MDPLPIDAYIPEAKAALARARAVVIVADPGAGKTTRIPPALTDAGPVLLLQPRRAAARAIARRIAAERRWTVGNEVGWQIRFEHRFGPETKLLVATEGILTARLQQDPLLSTFRTIVLDEFHERSVYADLGIALTKQAWRARDDLRVVVMSATIDADRVASFLDDCPIVRVAGRQHPLDVEYRPHTSASDAIGGLLQSGDGDILCFLPGAFEIHKAVSAVRSIAPTSVEVLPLHGALDAGEQDRVLSRNVGGSRRVIVATNIAETSVTVPGVSAVVDSGLQKVARYDAARAIDSLDTERVTQDSADQRAGRAGRTGPGTVRRLWDVRDRLCAHREPDIHRIDLSGTVLDIVGWGGDPRTLEWFEAPRSDAIESAIALLERLGAIDNHALTVVGQRLLTMPLHPRLARIVIAGNGSRAICRACAMLSERLFLPPRVATTTSDLLSALDEWDRLPVHIQDVAKNVEDLARHAGYATGGPISDVDFRQAILSGYPDRVARRRAQNSPGVKLSSGAGAVIASTSGVHTGEFLVAVDLQATNRPGDTETRVRIASLVEREWLKPTHTETLHELDDAGAIRATRRELYDALVLFERPAAIDDQIAAGMLAEAWLQKARSAEDQRLMVRLRFAGESFDLEEMARTAARGAKTLSDVHLAAGVSAPSMRRLERDAPDTLRVPSGRQIRLDYHDDGTISASVKLQELFGLAETPRIGRRREPVIFSLLAPNGRPVQVTRDLRSFWERTYPEVRKELRGRYPKHPWPDDPWTATPTARTKRKGTTN